MMRLVTVISLMLASAASSEQPSGARPCWHKAPTVSVMTGFIYEPRKPYTIQQWMENLGNHFNADQWVKDFKEAGASHVVFYDKWIDGLVFHDTKTTAFKTKRDFLRELAAGCRRGGLPLVIYFNAISDGNPEFNEWSLLDKQGRPIVFNTGWPTRCQTLHSPFRAKCLEQVRELLANYGPIHGIWYDIFRERFDTTSEWTAHGYEKMFGESFNQASPQQLAEFNARTLASYLDDVEAIRRKQRQEQCVFTANGSGGAFLAGGVWTEQVGARLQYLFMEGHNFQKNERLARMAWALPKPLDINLLLNRSWFTPLEDTPPPAKYTVDQTIAATAIAVCQGAGVNFALTPSHDGKFGEDLQRAKAVGSWFRKVQPWLAEAQPAADVAVIHGPVADAVTEALARTGVFSRWIAPDQTLPACRAIVVPPGSRTDERLGRFVNDGGLLIAFGNVGPLAETFGGDIKDKVRSAKQHHGATIKADSEYDWDSAAANALDDDLGTSWASSSTPMPHWVEITLPEPVEVQKVELISRQGPYLVTDVDVELPASDGWRVIKSIRGAKARKLIAKLDTPTKTSRVRVMILRELYRVKDCQKADVASIRILDRNGHDHAGVENAPAVLRSKAGKGEVLLVPCNSLPRAAQFWSDLSKLAFGEPAYLVSAEQAERFRFILTRVRDARVLHVIDAAVPADNYQPADVEVSLAAQLLAGRRCAALVGSNTALPVSEKNGWLSLVVQPNPVATIVLKESE